MKVLVTGAAGFIGSHVVIELVRKGHVVIGLDNINDYYDVNVKYGRLKRIGINIEEIGEGKLIQSNKCPDYAFVKMDLENAGWLAKMFEFYKFDAVINLAAQAGVRYSLENPRAYIDSNIVGFQNILECCRYHGIKHLVYASSSSVYGLNENFPFSTHNSVNHPVSIYAATKKAGELMAHAYSHLYRIPTTGLRFFTVYGPWGRPDMALFLFTKAILEGKPINVFNNGNMQRDFTYIDDIVNGILMVLDNPPEGDLNWNSEKPDPSSSTAPYRIYNIGNNSPVRLMDFIKEIEYNLDKKAEINYMPLQAGDVPITWADVDDLICDFGYSPSVSIKVGVKNFIDWYKDFFDSRV